MIALWGLVSICACIAAGMLALSKNRNYSAWAAWSFLLPPLIIVLLLLPRNRASASRTPSLDEEDRAEIT